MAILTGTTKTRFPEITDPNSGIGPLFARLQRNAINFLRSSQELFENNFVEEGTQNIPAFSTLDESFSGIKSPSVRRIITQRPQATIFVKKRMFSALRNNYDIRYMNDKEKLFLKASKLLMEKKAQDLSYYESLLNLESIFKSDGFLNIEQFTGKTLDSFFNAVNVIDPTLTNFTQKQIEDRSITDPYLSPYYRTFLQYLKLQEINKRSKGNVLTTWITDPEHPDTTGVGEGVGVIELNLVSTISTTVSLESGGGNASLTIEDPYRTLTITEADIELALRAALAEKDTTKKASQFISGQLLERAKQYDQNLNDARRRRKVSEVNFDYLLSAGNPVGVLVETGQEFDIYSIGNIDESQVFTGEEQAIVNQIFTLLREYTTTIKDNQALFQTINEQYNDVRQRLRNEFIGHTCIQQMDAIQIFMNSRTRDSTPSYDGRLDNELSLLGNIFTQQQSLSEDTIKAEWKANAPDIPYEFYRAMRDKTVFRQDGVQVFGGVVDSVSTSYEASSGTYKVSVRCKDNMEYLRLGRINTSPSLAQPGGMLEDPLTPFSLKIDDATGLISDTPQLSDVNKQRLKYLRFDDGPRAGQRIKEDNSLFIDKSVGGKILTYQHVPGLVYQWKTGIISETLNVNLSKPLNGVGATLSDVIGEYGVTVLENPFGGLDVADVISILVTGRPHSYASFLQDSLGAGQYNVDPTNQSKFYFNYLFDFLERGSGLLGDFVPAVPDIIDPVKASQLFNLKQKIEGFNSQLSGLLRQKADLEDNLTKRAESQLDIVSTQINKINKLVSDNVNEARNLATAISDEDAAKVSFNVIGNTVSVAFDTTQMPDVKEKLRYQLLKKSEETRYNQDKNYLVISDKYSSDIDIQAFAKNFKNFDLFNSDYKNPFTLCTDANRAVGFEFFADSQGNIVFRPPEYNKTPASLLIRLIELSRSENVSHIPVFLEKLFSTRKSTVEKQIFEVELRILEQFTLLGYVTSQLDLNVVNDFQFSISNSGSKWSLDVKTLIQEVTKETRFSPEEQSKLANGFGLNEGYYPDQSVPALLTTIRNTIHQLEGRDDLKKSPEDQDNIDTINQELEKYMIGNDVNARLNRLNATNKAATYVAQRQGLARTYRSLIQQNKEFHTPRYKDSKNSPFPKFMEDLIENDEQNYEGFNSGKRFIIYDEQIISMTLNVNSPDFTRITVTGNIDFLTKGQDGSLGSIPKVLWASAVDFDLWRQFGYRDGQSIFRPDFSAAEEQCAPYAVFKLQEQRKKIHQGSITIIGNEHYQAGDVIYLNNKNMLYYVTRVVHNFTFDNGRFTTTLDLSYGRALGEYIPTTLDIIGKHLLTSTRNGFSNIKSNRTTVSANHVLPLETLFVQEYSSLSITNSEIVPYYNYDVETEEQLNKRTNGENSVRIRNNFINDKTNIDKVRNAISKVASKVNTKTQGDVAIEIRTYYVSGDKDGQTQAKAKIIGQWVFDMITKTRKEEYQQILNGFQLDSKFVLLANPINIDPSSELTKDDQILRRFPSSAAWAGATKFSNSDGIGLPVNAIDIVFLIEKSQYGDQPSVTIRK